MTDDLIREALAKALHADMGCRSDEPCPWCEGRASALLPTVRRLIQDQHPLPSRRGCRADEIASETA